MWPPSSGSTGSRFRSAIARLTNPSVPRKSWIDCWYASEVTRTMPTVLETFLRPEPVTMLASPRNVPETTMPTTRNEFQVARRNDCPGPGSPRISKPTRYTPWSSRARRGPSVTRLPPRSTTMRNGRPFVPLIVWGIVAGVTR